ncbi:MAG: hypothetical protein H6746_20465 [Deltaproteobacteria bacterium]|nr:hypothetical protein [Deltaproteobacteria bacterium]
MTSGKVVGIIATMLNPRYKRGDTVEVSPEDPSTPDTTLQGVVVRVSECGQWLDVDVAGEWIAGVWIFRARRLSIRFMEGLGGRSHYPEDAVRACSGR